MIFWIMATSDGDDFENSRIKLGSCRVNIKAFNIDNFSLDWTGVGYRRACWRADTFFLNKRPYEHIGV